MLTTVQQHASSKTLFVMRRSILTRYYMSQFYRYTCIVLFDRTYYIYMCELPCWALQRLNQSSRYDRCQLGTPRISFAGIMNPFVIICIDNVIGLQIPTSFGVIHFSFCVLRNYHYNVFYIIVCDFFSKNKWITSTCIKFVPTIYQNI